MDAERISRPPSVKTASGVVRTGPCIFHGFLIGTDGVNDPVITIYNNTSSTGEEVIPSCTYDASLLGLNGATGMNIYCENGLYVDIACSGTVEVNVMYAALPTSR